MPRKYDNPNGEPGKDAGPVTIQIELDNLFVLAEPKLIQPNNGTAYISTKHAGRRIKAVIFEEE